MKAILDDIDSVYGPMMIYDITAIGSYAMPGFVGVLETTVDWINDFNLSAPGPSWEWYSNKLNLPAGTDYYATAHEVIHAYNDLAGVGGGIAVDGGMAWTAAEHILPAMDMFRLLDDKLTGQTCDDLYQVTNLLRNLWQGAWNQADVAGQTGTEPASVWPLSPVAFTMSNADMVNVKNHFGFTLPCKDIAEIYNNYLEQKGCCLWFVCEPGVEGPGVFPTAKVLSPALQ